MAAYRSDLSHPSLYVRGSMNAEVIIFDMLFLGGLEDIMSGRESPSLFE
jgi:hypothetical protein